MTCRIQQHFQFIVLDERDRNRQWEGVLLTRDQQKEKNVLVICSRFDCSQFHHPLDHTRVGRVNNTPELAYSILHGNLDHFEPTRKEIYT